MVSGFFEEYFVRPVMNGSGYNLVNTSVYALLLVVSAYVVFRALRKLNVEIDANFAMSLFPYIALGSIIRSLRDIGFLSGWVFVTPAVYIVVFSITFSSLVLSIFIAERMKLSYHSLFFAFGFALAGILFTQLRFHNLLAAAQILALDLFLFILIFVPILGQAPIWKASLWNKFAVFGQLFDASSTYVAMTFYGFGEQHVLPNILFDLAGGVWIFFIAKAAIALLFVWAVDSAIEDKNMKNFLKLIVFILGFGQGFRDLLMVAAFA